MLSELPNSMLKRQLGIAPGAAGGGILGMFFYVLDQIDMLIGVWVVLGLAVGVTAVRVLWSVGFLSLRISCSRLWAISLGCERRHGKTRRPTSGCSRARNRGSRDIQRLSARPLNLIGRPFNYN